MNDFTSDHAADDDITSLMASDDVPSMFAHKESRDTTERVTPTEPDDVTSSPIDDELPSADDMPTSSASPASPSELDDAALSARTNSDQVNLDFIPEVADFSNEHTLHQMMLHQKRAELVASVEYDRAREELARMEEIHTRALSNAMLHSEGRNSQKRDAYVKQITENERVQLTAAALHAERMKSAMFRNRLLVDFCASQLAYLSGK